MHLLPIKQTQEQILIQLGPENPLVGLPEYRNTLSDLVKNAGLGDPSRYWKNPAEKPDWKPAPKQDPEMMKAQASIAEARQKMQLSEMQHRQDLELAREKAANDMAVEKFKAEAKVQIERENAIAQAAITANQELARSGMFGNASADGIPPDDPQAMASIEALLAEGMKGLTGDLAAGMEADPMQAASLTGGMPTAAPVGASEAPEMDDAGEEPEGEEDGAETEADDEEEMKAELVASLADSVRQTSEQTAQAIQQMSASMEVMAQAMQKLGGPRGVRRGLDGKIEGVD
jgi:hypothetical protein